MPGNWEERIKKKLRFCYSAIKRNEVLMHATIWVSPGNIMLRAASHKGLHVV